jgi:anthranilate phosphoribosyltransferase
MKAVRGVRGALKVRTALNMLGPLLNPAHAAYGLVGTYSMDISELMAGSLLVGGGMESAVRDAQVDMSSRGMVDSPSTLTLIHPAI